MNLRPIVRGIIRNLVFFTSSSGKISFVVMSVILFAYKLLGFLYRVGRLCFFGMERHHQTPGLVIFCAAIISKVTGIACYFLSPVVFCCTRDWVRDYFYVKCREIYLIIGIKLQYERKNRNSIPITILNWEDSDDAAINIPKSKVIAYYSNVNDYVVKQYLVSKIHILYRHPSVVKTHSNLSRKFESDPHTLHFKHLITSTKFVFGERYLFRSCIDSSDKVLNYDLETHNNKKDERHLVAVYGQPRRGPYVFPNAPKMISYGYSLYNSTSINNPSSYNVMHDPKIQGFLLSNIVFAEIRLDVKIGEPGRRPSCVYKQVDKFVIATCYSTRTLTKHQYLVGSRAPAATLARLQRLGHHMNNYSHMCL